MPRRPKPPWLRKSPPPRDFPKPRRIKAKPAKRECGLCGWTGKTAGADCPECSTPLTWGKEAAE